MFNYRFFLKGVPVSPCSPLLRDIITHLASSVILVRLEETLLEHCASVCHSVTDLIPLCCADESTEVKKYYPQRETETG